MKNPEFIKISNVKVSDNKLKVKLDFSKKISKYFFKNSFEVYYDKNIESVDESILTIPAVAATIQISWATGADLYVEKLDEKYLQSLKNIRKVFEGSFPKFSSSGTIHVKKIIPNKFNNKQSALLFSGGLDSLVSYVRNKDQHPILITILRGDNSFPNNEYHRRLRNWYRKFAEQEGVEIHLITSKMWNNNSDTINCDLLAREFETHDWWEVVSHGLILMGLCIPLTTERIGKLLIASTYKKNYQRVHGSHFLANIDFSWADVNVFYDGDLTRQEKIGVLNPYVSYHKYLRCCHYWNLRPDLKNCGGCEKCLRTMTGLVLEGIDPKECNFDTKNNFLDYTKCLYIKGLIKFSHWRLWTDIQKHIPDTINDDEVSRRYHAKQFFEWLRDFDIKNYKQKNSFTRNLKLSYYSLKYKGISYTSKKIQRYISKIMAK